MPLLPQKKFQLKQKMDTNVPLTFCRLSGTKTTIRDDLKRQNNVTQNFKKWSNIFIIQKSE